MTVRFAVDQLANEFRSGAYVAEGEKLPPGMKPMKWTWVIQTFGVSLLDKRVGEVSPEVIRSAISGAKLHPGPLTGEFFVQALKVLWNWMNAREFTDHNPVDAVLDGTDGGEPLTPKRRRGRRSAKKRPPAKDTSKVTAADSDADEEKPPVTASHEEPSTSTSQSSTAADDNPNKPQIDDQPVDPAADSTPETVKVAPKEQRTDRVTAPEEPTPDATPQTPDVGDARTSSGHSESDDSEAAEQPSAFRMALRAAGVRAAEIDGLLWSDFDVKVGHVQVSRMRDSQGNWTELTEQRLVPLDEDTQKLFLDTLIDQQHPILVFPK